MTDIGMLRTQLRAINMEYSVLLRARAGEKRFVRLAELKAERLALMSMIAGSEEGAPKAPGLARHHPGPQRPPLAPEAVRGA